jgi:hypothetical protein
MGSAISDARTLLGSEIDAAAASIPQDQMMSLAPYDAFRLARAHKHLGVSELEILHAIVVAVQARSRTAQAPAESAAPGG